MALIDFNIIKIPKSKEESDAIFFLKFYRKHIKKYKLLRAVFIFLWGNFFRRIYLGLLKTKAVLAGQYYCLTSLRKLIEVDNYTFQILNESDVCKTPTPKVYPQKFQKILVSPHQKYIYPQIYFTKIQNVKVFGGTNMLIKEGEVICHDLFDAKNDLTSEEFHLRMDINRQTFLVSWNMQDDLPFELPVAISVVEACANNYAHWLTEVLSKIAILRQSKQLSTIPLIVNDDLHPNILDSLALFLDEKTPIYQLSVGRAVVVKELYVISVAGYVPWDRVNKNVYSDSHGMFSTTAFSIIREAAKSLFKADIDYPDRIYIKRNSTARNVKNSDQIEDILIREGFTIIEPEKLTFKEQVLYFQNAKVVVGVSGAAMANIIFSPVDARIFILIGNYPYTAYWYWQNIACASGKTVKYIMGEVQSSLEDPIHANIIVNPQILLEAIK